MVLVQGIRIRLRPNKFLNLGLGHRFFTVTVRVGLSKWPLNVSAQTRTRLRELRPQLVEMHKKYGHDRQRLTVEMQRFQRTYNVNPLLQYAWPLYVVARLLISLALIHVLISFNRTADWLFHDAHLSDDTNRATANYVFGPTDVRNFLDANLHGAPLGSNMMQTTGFAAFHHCDRGAVVVVGACMAILIASISYAGPVWINSRRETPARWAPTLWRSLLLYSALPIAWLMLSPWLLLGYMVYVLAHLVVSIAKDPRVRGKATQAAESKRGGDREPGQGLLAQDGDAV